MNMVLLLGLIDKDTEITHSEMKADGTVKVYIETPDENVCFKHATCYLPEYRWEDVYEYTEEELDRIKEVVESTAHLILEFSQEGGYANDSSF